LVCFQSHITSAVELVVTHHWLSCSQHSSEKCRWHLEVKFWLSGSWQLHCWPRRCYT